VHQDCKGTSVFSAQHLAQKPQIPILVLIRLLGAGVIKGRSSAFFLQNNLAISAIISNWVIIQHTAHSTQHTVHCMFSWSGMAWGIL